MGVSTHSLYFFGYAALATLATIVMAWAQYTRYKREGIQFNYTMIRIAGGVSLAMWTGGAFTEYAYKLTVAAAGWSAFFLGIIFSAFFVWQINILMRKILEDEKTIEQLSTHDAITGLRNRRFFHQTLIEQIDKAADKNRPLSLLMFDIDDLAGINDEYGWTSGDMILRELGNRLTDAACSTDFACSFGADKTAIILTGTDSEEAAKRANELRSIIGEKPFKIEKGATLDLTFNVGISTVSERTSNDVSLVKEALAAQTVSRESGGNSSYMYVGENDIQKV